MSETSKSDTPIDPLVAMLMQDPPRDALDFRAKLDAFALQGNTNPPEIGGSDDDVVLFEQGGTPVTADIHRPRGAGPFPVLVYLHGGGWIMGTPKTHRKLGFRFAEAGFLVVNLNYRLAPEHPFPAGFDDCVAAIRWTVRNAARYGGDPTRLAVGGDSAGGNLTAASCIALAGDAEVRVRAALLIYAALDFASMATGAAAPGMPDFGEMMVGSYLGAAPGRNAKLADVRVSPIHGLARMPPTHVMCGTNDALLADARRAEAALEAAGVRHAYQEYAGMPHGFVQFEDAFPEARRSIDAMVAFLRGELGS